MSVYPCLGFQTLGLGPHQLWGVFGAVAGKLCPACLIHDPPPSPLPRCRYQPSAQMHNLKWRCLRVKQGIHLHKEDRYTGNMNSSSRLITIYDKLSNSTNTPGTNTIFIRFDRVRHLSLNLFDQFLRACKQRDRALKAALCNFL